MVLTSVNRLQRTCNNKMQCGWSKAHVAPVWTPLQPRWSPVISCNRNQRQFRHSCRLAQIHKHWTLCDEIRGSAILAGCEGKKCTYRWNNAQVSGQCRGEGHTDASPANQPSSKHQSSILGVTCTKVVSSTFSFAYKRDHPSTGI